MAEPKDIAELIMAHARSGSGAWDEAGGPDAVMREMPGYADTEYMIFLPGVLITVEREIVK